MKNYLEIDHGLVLNDFKIRLDNEFTFKESTKAILHVIEYNGYFKYSFECVFCEMSFSFTQSFHQSKKYGSPFMLWLEGRCHKLGWDSTRSDLDKDFIELVTNIESFTRIKGIKLDDYSFKFFLNGLKISVVSSPQTMSCYIEFGV